MLMKGVWILFLWKVSRLMILFELIRYLTCHIYLLNFSSLLCLLFICGWSNTFDYWARVRKRVSNRFFLKLTLKLESLQIGDPTLFVDLKLNKYPVYIMAQFWWYSQKVIKKSLIIDLFLIISASFFMPIPLVATLFFFDTNLFFLQILKILLSKILI